LHRPREFVGASRIRREQLVPDVAALQRARPNFGARRRLNRVGHYPLLFPAVQASAGSLVLAVSKIGSNPPQNMRWPENGISPSGFMLSSAMIFFQASSRVALSG